MGRSHVSPIKQPDDQTCGPASLKIALHILGIRRSLTFLMKLCKTNSNGTSTANMIIAANKLGLWVLAVENATLRHVQGALRYPPNKIRATIVSYLYDLDEDDEPHPDSGHWATVSSFSASKSRIILLDSSSGQKKSYAWADFRARWKDFDLKRKKIRNDNGTSFKMVQKWQPQLLLVLAKSEKDLPKFTIETAKVFPPTE